MPLHRTLHSLQRVFHHGNRDELATRSRSPFSGTTADRFRTSCRLGKCDRYFTKHLDLGICTFSKIVHVVGSARVCESEC